MDDPQKKTDQDPDLALRPDRRGFVSTVAMGAGLAAGYGTLGAMAGRFLYPARPAERQWLYVAQLDGFEQDQSLVYRAPSGETINITRKATNGNSEDFVALSSTCPHLGCQVHWEGQNDRYFCPCHNGSFDPAGKGTGGPPGDAGQSLPRYDVDVRDGLLYIHVAVTRLASGEDDKPAEEGRVVEARRSRAGHDPCLDPNDDPKSRRT